MHQATASGIEQRLAGRAFAVVGDVWESRVSQLSVQQLPVEGDDGVVAFDHETQGVESCQVLHERAQTRATGDRVRSLVRAVRDRLDAEVVEGGENLPASR